MAARTATPRPGAALVPAHERSPDLAGGTLAGVMGRTTMADKLRVEGEIIETTAGQIAAELQRRGIDPARPVLVAVEPDDWIAEARRFARPKVVAEGLSDEDIDRLIKRAQRDVGPGLE